MRPYSATTVHTAVREHVGGRHYKEICTQYGMCCHTLFLWVRMYRGCDEKQIAHMIEQKRTLDAMRVKLKIATSQVNACAALFMELAPVPRDRVALAKRLIAGGQGFSATLATLGLADSTFLYKPHPPDYSHLREHMIRLRAQHPEWGLGKLVPIMRAEGAVLGMGIAWKLYKELRLQCVGRGPAIKRPLPAKPIAIPAKPNHTWSMDYALVKLQGRKRVWALNVVDDFNREGLTCALQQRPTAAMLIAELDRIITLRGRPVQIRCDNGQQFVAELTKAWARRKRVRLLFIERGKPTQNAIIERFHYTFRVEVLRRQTFANLAACQRAASNWLRVYNNDRPHGSLGNQPPRGYLRSKGVAAAEVLPGARGY